jgi:hypothetical protein
VDGKLSTSQLRLAYSTLVRSATMTSTTTTGVPGSDASYTLAWYCVQLLVDTIRDLSPLSYTSQKNPKSQGTPPRKRLVEDADSNTNTMKAGDDDRIHRLSLMLISTISSLPMTIMLRALDEVYYIIIGAYSLLPSRDDSGGVDDVDGNNKEGAEQSVNRKGKRKKELLEAAMKWWYTYYPVLISESGHVDGGERQEGLGPLGWFTKCWRGVEKVKDLDAVGEREREEGRSSSNSFVLSRL